MMEYLILDIETVPIEITDETVKNYLMDKKISKEQRSFDPNYSKIITICLKENNQETKILASDDEKPLLKEFWEILRNKPNILIVTHNGYHFDIPFIILRSIINNVHIPLQINTNKFSMEKSNHFDTMLFFSFYGNFTNPNLDILCRLNNIQVPHNRFSGADIEKLYQNKEWDKIKNKCKQDVELLEELFVKSCQNYLKYKY